MGAESTEELPMYIHYIAARKYLADKFGATPHEIAMWTWLGNDGKRAASGKDVGLRAYVNAAQCGHPPMICESAADEDDSICFDEQATIPARFAFPEWQDATSMDYLGALMSAYFLRADLETFDPEERYIGFEDLLDLWAKKMPRNDAFALIREKAKFDTDLPSFHPISGGAHSERIAGVSAEDPQGLQVPSFQDCIFSLDDVRAVEEEWEIPAMARGTSHPRSIGPRRDVASESVRSEADARDVAGTDADLDPAAAIVRQRDAALEKGRATSNNIRQEAARHRQALLEDAVIGLLQSPDWKFTKCAAIAAFVSNRFDLGYKASTLEGKVKKIVAAYRARCANEPPGLARTVSVLARPVNT